MALYRDKVYLYTLIMHSCYYSHDMKYCLFNVEVNIIIIWGGGKTRDNCELKKK